MFKIHHIENSHSSAPDIFSIGAAVGEYVPGMPLVVANGVLTPITTATTKPTHICAVQKNIKNAGDALPVFSVSHDIVFEVEAVHSADPAAIVSGTVLTLEIASSKATGNVTDVKTNGVVTVYNKLEASASPAASSKETILVKII